MATLLGYGEPQILEVFKNILPTKLYWVLFPIENLRQTVETAKGILTNEKIDRQLAGHSLSTPFMSVKTVATKGLPLMCKADWKIRQINLQL